MINVNFKKNTITIIISILLIMFLIDKFDKSLKESNNDPNTLYIISSYDNKNIEDEVIKYAKKTNKKVEFTYMGDLDIVEELNLNSSKYDAVWISNSMWLYMLDNSYLTSNSKSISISPVVFGLRKSKAKELNLIGNTITNSDILNLIKDKKIKYVMPSVTQTNTGATAYLGFVESLAGNPEVLTEDMLKNEELKNNLKDIFSGVERVSGDESYLEEMVMNDDSYEAIISSESSIINMNKKLKESNKEEFYMLYPTDGVAINDSTFALINSEKTDMFLDIQKYLLSDDGQEMLKENGRRTWYGGTNDNVDKKIFNTDWGIDTSSYLNVTRFPSKDVITKAINLYIETLRKPTHVVFCLDYSGSMRGSGQEELTNAMNYILDYNKSSIDKLQFSESDKITVITFSSNVEDIWSSTGHNTEDLINRINNKATSNATALYDAIIEGLNILNDESDDYTKTIIAMTDGEVNIGYFKDLEYKYNKLKTNIPIYSITFGRADERELEEIAKLSNSKVFDGKTDLLKAFKEVRGYN